MIGEFLHELGRVVVGLEAAPVLVAVLVAEAANFKADVIEVGRIAHECSFVGGHSSSQKPWGPEHFDRTEATLVEVVFHRPASGISVAPKDGVEDFLVVMTSPGIPAVGELVVVGRHGAGQMTE